MHLMHLHMLHLLHLLHMLHHLLHGRSHHVGAAAGRRRSQRLRLGRLRRMRNLHLARLRLELGAAAAGRLRLGLRRNLDDRRAWRLEDTALSEVDDRELLALALTKFTLDGVAISLTMGVFELTVNDTAVLLATITGLLLGALGALPPAWRCLQMSIPESLKAA